MVSLAASVAMGVSSLALTPSAALAKDAETISGYFTPALKELNDKPRAIYHTWNRYGESPAGDSFPAMGDEYVILAASDGRLSTRPYSYSYRYDTNFQDKSPGEVHWQGISERASLGGSWIRRGDLTGFLPRSIARLDDDITVTDLSGRLGRQVQTISSSSPTEKAASILGTGSTLPVQEGSVNTSSRAGHTYISWQTGAYTNYAGDSCDGSLVQATFTALPGGQLRLNEYEIDELNCTNAAGQPVSTYHDFSVRPWNAIVGAAPQPNVSAQN
jgi:hypothetical protein